MLLIIERFADRTEINGRTSYTSLVKIFQQQCEVIEGRVVVLAKTGGDVIQNPSDLDATYDGHQGQGQHCSALGLLAGADFIFVRHVFCATPGVGYMTAHEN